MWPSRSPKSVFHARRKRLSDELGDVSALLPAGRVRAKNYPGNTHPFRADSHFLYLLGRSIPDAALPPDALASLRLSHDAAGISQLGQAASAPALAHKAGMRATRHGIREAEVAAAMVAAPSASGMGMSYEPIVTVHGEVLHNRSYDNVIGYGDLVLAGVGAETPGGWAGDVTRASPANGHLSSTQPALYEALVVGA